MHTHTHLQVGRTRVVDEARDVSLVCRVNDEIVREVHRVDGLVLRRRRVPPLPFVPVDHLAHVLNHNVAMADRAVCAHAPALRGAWRMARRRAREGRRTRRGVAMRAKRRCGGRRWRTAESSRRAMRTTGRRRARGRVPAKGRVHGAPRRCTARPAARLVERLEDAERRVHATLNPPIVARDLAYSARCGRALVERVPIEAALAAAEAGRAACTRLALAALGAVHPRRAPDRAADE